MANRPTALAALAAGVEAQLALLRLPASGRRVVEREALTGTKALFHEAKNLIDDLAGNHSETKVMFAEVERCYRTVLAHADGQAAKQARLEMERLDHLWDTKLRKDLKKHLEGRARAVDKVSDKEATRRATEVVRKLDDRLGTRSGFISYASQLPFENPRAFRLAVRKHLAESESFTSRETLAELTDVTNHMSFLKRSPKPPAKTASQGDELLRDLRAMEARGTKTSRRGAELPNAPHIWRQIEAVARLEQFCGEGDVLWDDIADLLGRRLASEPPHVAAKADTNVALVKELVDKVQGRIGEVLALRHADFAKDVWEPAARAAEVLRATLNKTDLPDVLPAHQWCVEVITEPTFATTATGRGGELLDSGVWLVRDSPEGNFAMPLFVLEVKSGELRGSISQQVLNQERMKGGLIDLPSTGRRYRIVPPAIVDTQAALASTRSITDKRILGMVRGGPVVAGTLSAGDTLITVKLPMSRSDIRAASFAMVIKRIEQLKK